MSAIDEESGEGVAMGQHKPLSAAEIEALRMLNREYRECGDWTFDEREYVANALPRLLSMLQPPTDAAVLEAVEYFEQKPRAVLRGLHPHINTILSHVRAVQSPGLTEEQAAALHIAYLRCKEEGSLTDVVEILESTFPGVFGQEG